MSWKLNFSICLLCTVFAVITVHADDTTDAPKKEDWGCKTTSGGMAMNKATEPCCKEAELKCTKGSFGGARNHYTCKTYSQEDKDKVTKCCKGKKLKAGPIVGVGKDC